MNREDFDVSRAVEAWTEEPPADKDEQDFAPWIPRGWASWNDMSPEVEFCEFAALLARMIAPSLLIETGVGQGFTTRRLPDALTLCFEADDTFRAALQGIDLFGGNHQLSEKPTPTAGDFANAPLSLLDSNEPWREAELKLWAEHAPSGAVALIHDTGNGHPDDGPHMKVRRDVEGLGLPGVFFKNPRGAWLGFKP